MIRRVAVVLVSRWRPAIVAAVAALVVYAVTLGGTYVYDDRYIVLADPRIGDVSLWHEYWTKDYFYGAADNLYRPLVSMSYAVQAKLHGRGEEVAWAFHLVNWLLHAGVSAAVAELARRMTRSTAVATISGLLFAVHPIHVEAVANIVGRAELMCGLGVTLALALFFKPLTNARAVAIWACMVLAILSKEQGLLLPLMLIAAIPIRRRNVITGDAETSPALAGGATGGGSEVLDYARADTPAARRRRLSGPPVVLFLLVLWTISGYLIFRESILKLWWDRSFLDRTINPIVASVGLDRALMPLVLLGRYIALLAAPVRLNLDYGHETIGSVVSLADPYLYLGAGTVIVAMAGCIVALRKRAWVALFCIVGFALVYGMIGNVVTLIGTNFGERLMYLPSLFAIVLAALGLARLPRGAMVATVAAIVLLFSLRTVTYAARWNEPLRLFEIAAEQHPRAIRPYLLLADELARRGEMAAAAEVLGRARQVAPDYYRVWLSSAHVAMAMDDPARAVEFAARARQLAPTLESDNLITRAREALRAAATRPGAATTAPGSPR